MRGGKHRTGVRVKDIIPRAATDAKGRVSVTSQAGWFFGVWWHPE
jgi:hypothetical protein